MFDKVKALVARCEELERRLADPEVVGQPALCAALSREHGRLAKLAASYREYEEVEARIRETEALLADAKTDADLARLAREELSTLQERRRQLCELLGDLLTREEDDDLDRCIVEIRAGTGGEEAALFARDLFLMYQRFAERRGWRLELISQQETDLGGFKEVIFGLSGPEVYRHLRFESGGHRVQRVPKTESSGRKHTSAATVVVLPEVEETQVEIKKEDLHIERMRASGPGGQNVNKVSSAVRITHKPTGLVVSCQDEQSQHKNLAKAMRVLRSRLYDLQKRQQKEKINQARRARIGTGDRSDRIRTYNFHQNRVTDHRINFTTYDLQGIMDGRLDPIIEALMEHDRAQRLKTL